MEPSNVTLPSPPPSQPETTATTAILGPAGSMTWSHLNLIDQLLHDKDRLLRHKGDTMRSRTEQKRHEEVNEDRGRVSELERALKARAEEIDHTKPQLGHQKQSMRVLSQRTENLRKHSMITWRDMAPMKTLTNTRDIPSLLASVSAKLQVLEQRPSEAHEEVREEAAPSSVTMHGSKRKVDEMSEASEAPHDFPFALAQEMPSAGANEVSTSVDHAEPSEQVTHAESLIDEQQDLDNGPSLFESPFLRRQTAKLVAMGTGPLVQHSAMARESTQSSAMSLDLTRTSEREEVLLETQEDDRSTQTAAAAMTRSRDDLLLPMRVTIRPLIESATGGTFRLAEFNIMAEEVLLSIYSTLKKVQDKRTAGKHTVHLQSKRTRPCCYVWLSGAQSRMSWTIDQPKRFACKGCLKYGRACFTRQDNGLWTLLPLLPAARPKDATEADASYYIYQGQASTDVFDKFYGLNPAQRSILKKQLAGYKDG
ncbi:hypothetical protein AC579_6970 [Pseudocercospora musae]|uniref:Uncharacterized protein n=1 Tax=Pseudocercospora musae TaxID=113226 RepID=A0A139IAE4_9PEZI|nr:hypothetical protein AC579_6970 [Pseudocercospora musae]